jgi:rhamnogalacturonyl hydrolase YesR
MEGVLKALACLLLAALPATPESLQPISLPGAAAQSPTVLLLGGLTSRDAGADAINQAVKTLQRTPQSKRRINLDAVPVANPAAEQLVFPPIGIAYRQNGQSHFIWRYLALHGPDLVIVVGDDHGLASALTSIPVVHAPPDAAAILRAIPKQIAASDARKELDRRRSRTPRQVAEELAKVYGHDFDQPVYIPAMALISRLRLGQTADVTALVAPYVDGAKNSLANATASHLAGHLIFAELAARTGDQRYVDRVRAAADLAFTESGEMKDAMPMHSEMSDAVFMGCPILASAGRLTGRQAYFDMAQRHFLFMQKLCLRPDGLYRHSPLNEAAWGRGNAFPALGLSWTLLNMPQNHPAYAAMVRNFKEHMATLAKFQDRDGMWHEVIDDPASYQEFSATAMIATAMLRGVSHGWLDPGYAERAQAAWRALLVRIGPDGVLIDVCESTGKQKSLDDYLNRAASFGKDPRGGGMALLLATEIM